MPIIPSLRGTGRERTLQRLLSNTFLALMWSCAGAQADTPSLTLGGFGTLGIVHSSEDHADFTSSLLKPGGAGYGHSWSTDPDSLLAVQVTANLNSQLSAVLQVISEQNYDDTYKPHVEWGNIKYQFTPDFSVRLGRIIVPSFLVSDSRKIGYANPWVRPPVEVYALVPITSSDGVDASYRLEFGDFVHTLTGTFGNTNTSEGDGSRSKARQQWSIADILEYHSATAHISYHEARLSVDGFRDLFNAFRQFGPDGAAIADKYDVDGKHIWFFGIGGMYDPHDWFVTGEWGESGSRTVLGTRYGWYVSGGPRLGRFTPFATYGRLKGTSNNSDPGLNVAALPSFLAGSASGLNAALNSILASSAGQNTASVGVRWDVLKTVDIKVQFDHTNLRRGSSGVLTDVQPDFTPGGAVNLFSATIDFVW